MRLREPYLNAAVLLGLIALPLAALLADAPFTITLATRAVILALAAVVGEAFHLELARELLRWVVFLFLDRTSTRNP